METMKRSHVASLVVAAATIASPFVYLLQTSSAVRAASTAHDPGVRGGPPAAGNALPGLTQAQLALFNLAKTEFASVEEVADGLGPTMNLSSCNVEMGITNDLFQTERYESANCPTQMPGTPNDATTSNTLSAIEQFAVFMRFLAPPTPNPTFPGGSASILRGKGQFNSVGCVHCHTPTLTTGKSTVAALSNKPVNLYSDLMVHDMGLGLADGVSQGQAGPSEFRTAPLWGLGQRIFFLHDGRTSDLIVAIEQHQSGSSSAGNASEANAVIARFNNLSESDKQDLLNFLRSL
jgi:Di-haem oxidoreductase, putative peroxidase